MMFSPYPHLHHIAIVWTNPEDVCVCFYGRPAAHSWGIMAKFWREDPYYRAAVTTSRGEGQRPFSQRPSGELLLDLF